MIFNSEAEIVAYYAGRIEEADRWAWWRTGIKYCGVVCAGNIECTYNRTAYSDITPLQDVRTELELQRDKVLALFRAQK